MSEFTLSSLVTYLENTSSYNCFCSLLEADAYHGRRLNNDTWRTATEDTRTSALFHATDILHRQKWMGIPTSYSQALAWPREFIPNRISLNQGFSGDIVHVNADTPESLSFEYLSATSIPQFLKDATAELANYLIVRAASGKDEVSQFTDQVSSIGLGGGALNLSFREEKGAMTDMPDQVLSIIRDFLTELTEYDINSVGAYNAPLKRS